jgi:hydrogenase maturation factor
MCLAVPGRIIELTREADLRFGKVEFGGVRRSVCLEHVLDEAEALRELAFLASLGELEDA